VGSNPTLSASQHLGAVLLGRQRPKIPKAGSGAAMLYAVYSRFTAVMLLLLAECDNAV
jgi:hypothetical protein